MSKKGLISTFFLLILNYAVRAEFDPCKFNFGTDWDYINQNKSSSVAQAVDYVTIWLNDPSFNTYWHGTMLDFCEQNNKTPVFYSYIIAKSSALGDADVGGALARKGANFIRTQWTKVTDTYKNYASSTASRYGTEKPVIWLMEPDYFQYASGSQEGGGLSYAELSTKMKELIGIIKGHLPNAIISLDISPWNNNQSSYISAFEMSDFSFMNTSGGRTEGGNTRIRMDNNNNVTWKGVNEASGKGIIADDGYGSGGGSTGHATDWDDVNNLKARIADGVIAITQKSPNSSWGSTIENLRTQLANSKTVSCGTVGAKCKLTITAGVGGGIIKDKDGTDFTKGTVVTLVANASDGYEFDNWTGDASGNDETLKVTMDSDISVKANFIIIPSNSFTVTLKSNGSGSVKKTPEQKYYESGTPVTITATPVNGLSIFEGWSGDFTGTEKSCQVTVTKNMQITAKFKDTLTIDSIKIEAENYSQKTGDKLVVETNGNLKNIGYIENGYSTTYQINITRAGTYKIICRVASGLSSASFDVTIDNFSKGTISFTGTNDNGRWAEYKNETLSQDVDLSPGNHTLVLNFKAALNVDYIIFKMEKPEINGVRTSVKTVSENRLKITPVKGGFRASLPSKHQYETYSLYDFQGQKIISGKVMRGVSSLAFQNLTNNIWILWLEGADGKAAVRAAVVK